MHKALVIDFGYVVDNLVFIERAERRRGNNLRFSAGEHGGTMNARHQVNLRVQRTDFVDGAAVRTNLVFNDQAADFIRFNVAADLSNLLKRTGFRFFAFVFFCFVFRYRLVDQRIDCSVALEFF